MAKQATVSKLSKEEKLKNIEDLWYEIGVTCTKSFDLNNDIVSIRGGAAAHRCSMQAMRDQMRYNLSK